MCKVMLQGIGVVFFVFGIEGYYIFGEVVLVEVVVVKFQWVFFVVIKMVVGVQVIKNNIQILVIIYVGQLQVVLLIGIWEGECCFGKIFVLVYQDLYFYKFFGYYQVQFIILVYIILGGCGNYVDIGQFRVVLCCYVGKVVLVIIL